jgi:hypothetical protein
LDGPVEVARFRGLRVLDLEEDGEVGVDGEADLEPDLVRRVVHDGQFLVEAAVSDDPSPLDRQRRVGVGGAGPRDEKELRREILEVVRGEDLEALAVDREAETRQESSVAVEETVRLVRRAVDVPVSRADHERIALQNTDGRRPHGIAPPVELIRVCARPGRVESVAAPTSCGRSARRSGLRASCSR